MDVGSHEQLLDAVHGMADVLTDAVHFMTDTVSGLTCDELESICTVFEVAGLTGAATDLRVAHAAVDEEGDLHYGFTDPEGDS